MSSIWSRIQRILQTSPACSVLLAALKSRPKLFSLPGCLFHLSLRSLQLVIVPTQAVDHQPEGAPSCLGCRLFGRADFVFFTAVSRGTKDMIQPCIVHPASHLFGGAGVALVAIASTQCQLQTHAVSERIAAPRVEWTALHHLFGAPSCVYRLGDRIYTNSLYVCSRVSTCRSSLQLALCDPLAVANTSCHNRYGAQASSGHRCSRRRTSSPSR